MKGKRALKVSILVVILALVIGASLMFRKGNAGPIVQKELTHQQFNQMLLTQILRFKKVTVIV